MIRSILSLVACVALCSSAFAQGATTNGTIPEPGIVALVAMGVGSVLMARRRNRK